MLVTLTLIMITVLSVPKDDLLVFNWDWEKEGIIPFIATIVSVSIVIFSILTTAIYDKLRFVFAKTIYFQSDKIEDENEKNTSFSIIEKQLKNNIIESNNIAEGLFSRSSTCLIVGCVISILGVFVFYLLNSGTEYNSLDISQQLFTLLPRFGILFFIEYVAFFFLKQYRILMEEYRYYEAVKRDRQNLLSIYYLVDKYKDEKEILELMNNYIDKHSAEIPKYSGDNRVKMEKSLNEDMDLISKIIKLIQVIKTPDKSKE